eukprot:8077564-Pyramimonas_sp.AAC.1
MFASSHSAQSCNPSPMQPAGADPRRWRPPARRSPSSGARLFAASVWAARMILTWPSCDVFASLQTQTSCSAPSASRARWRPR